MAPRFFTIDAANPQETTAFGHRLGELLFPGAVVALIGPLGAGKTHLVRAIAEGLKIPDSRAVSSPTFVLIQEYAARLPIYHFDAYRLHSAAEFADLGVHEYFDGDGVCLVEWADRVETCLPAEQLRVTIVITGPDSRRFEIEARGVRNERIVGLVREAQARGASMLVLGTRNRKKREEIVEILGDLGLEFGDLSQWPDLPDVVEDGDTFEANARKKATEVAKALNHWVLAEDSGLVVPELNGRPGVYSARYAGKQGDDAANNARLLAELAPLKNARRDAYYVCTAALSNPAGEVQAVAEGRCHGVILREEHGSGGFGYDPLFLIPEYHRTFGELSATVKHALSHRARALTQLRPTLRRLFPA